MKIGLHCILGGELIEDEQAVDARFIIMMDIAETRPTSTIGSEGDVPLYTSLKFAALTSGIRS
jgi:hypothetical protein